MRPDEEPTGSRWRLLLAGPGDPGAALAARLRRRNAFELRTLRLPDDGVTDPAQTLVRAFKTASSLFGRMRGYQAAMLDAPATDVVRLLPWVFAACRARRVPLVVRVCSGRLVRELARAPRLRQRACERALGAAGLVLLRGRDDVEPLAKLGTARWLPACGEPREAEPRFDEHGLRVPGPEHADSICRRLLVACDALDARDLAGLLAASDALPDGATLTLAGARDRAPVAHHPRAAWIEVEGPRDIERLIDDHDALIEPDPGPDDDAPERIVHALQAGLPVVAGLGGDVEHYVAHDVAGLLVAPRAYGELGRALCTLVLDPSQYARLCHGAHAAGARFDAYRWNEELEDWLFQVCDQGAVSRTVPFYEREERARSTRSDRLSA